MTTHSDANVTLEHYIAAMRLKILEQLTETSPGSMSVSEIDALEFSLEQNVRRPLRSLRNSRQSCNRIPPEVVIRIAHYCSSPTFDTPWYTCLLKSTHLCHRWREIIISCPSLWALIQLQPPKIASIFLERSGDLPLNIYTLYDFCCEPTHLSRIKTLRLRVSGLDGLSEIFSRLITPSPVISEVIIEVTGSVYGYCPDLPPLFGDTSTIRSLSLDGLSFDTKLLCFTSLTSLNLDIPGALLLPFFDLLTVNPTLESISISAWGVIPAEGVDGPAITLNNLATLRCRDASKYLLSRLSLPRSTSIQIEDTGPPLTLSRSLPNSITNLRCLTWIEGLCLTTTTGVTYSGQTTDAHKIELVGCGGSFYIHWVVGYDGLREFDPRPLSLAHVRELCITHETISKRPRASELNLSSLFREVRSLEVLKFHSRLLADCNYILPPFVDNHICPSLHTVEIVHCSGQAQWLSSLLYMAIRRRDAGLALRKVLVSPHPDVNSPTQSYIRELNDVLTNPA
ncbi:hypothetical protein BDM02DRAFT_3272309 [Thelephora ganbajun]|uniref:Uncharacterized protein n=1 Tax=Thelephora ganbajun TaxID=370292 RepID=A0ACB6Z4V0_THEGA|nr:hypothetical protein BDM02DRAFT_3272309 [Thelephora ganbajun]